MRIEPVGIFEPSVGITYVSKVNPAIREANIQIRKKRELQEKRVNATRYMDNNLRSREIIPRSWYKLLAIILASP